MTPPRADTHTHTLYCGHADQRMTVAASVAAAEAAGLEVLAVTEHLYEPAHLERIERIRADLELLTPACRVYLGAEVDADPVSEDGGLMAPVDGLAYVIAATHKYPGGEHWWNQPPPLDAGEKAAVVERWFAWAARIVANPAVDTLAHPGVLMARGALVPDFDLVLPRFRELFAIAAEHGTLIELNELAALKMSPAHRATYPLLMRAAVDAGCRIVFASDAHRPEAVGRFEWTVDVARAAALPVGSVVVPAWRQ